MSETVANAVIRLVRKQPFYGALLMNLRRVTGERAASITPTAAVFVRRDASVGLAVNPGFFEGLTHVEQEAVLVHECMHVINLHLERLATDMPDPYLANIAMDIAINQFIEGLPEGALGIDSFASVQLEPERTADHYYERLKQQADAVQQALSAGAGELVDDHDAWGQAEAGDDGPGGLSRSLREAACRHAVQDAVKQAKSGGSWGKVPRGVQRMVEAALAPKIDWRRELRRFVGDRVKVGHTSTRKRPNRRFGWDYAGKKTVRGANLLVAVDTSGSIGSRELGQFLAEIDAIAGKARVLLAEVDAKVHIVEEYKPRRAPPEFRGGGGTSFQVVWDAIESRAFPTLRHKPDGIVYLTDGWAPWPKGDLGIPTLWLFTDRRKVGQAPFGKQLFLEVG